MTTERILLLISSGDVPGLKKLALAGLPETFSEADKNAFTRAAARAGHAEMLRYLFEYNHLYATDPDGEGRTLLHFAALSGDAETVRFTVDVLGFDPLTGECRGKTALDYAQAAEKPDAYAWLSARLGFSLEDGYRNPILRGFHPDPSIVRVGMDYYLVNSSFVQFPGLPISHSRDLVHWQVIGHAVENLSLSGLEGLPGGFGYWAPDISYDKGRFWVVATLRRNTPPYRLQMITSAPDPRGPWDAPKFLPLDGIDPSLFADDDGRRYMLLNPGAILVEIDDAGDLISEPEMIYFGSARIKPEGPHLLKKDGWYYLFLAEGGTGPDHMETVHRARSLRGPYEACPFNPILGRKNPFSPIGRSGHGKPVMLPDGQWMMVYLVGRSVERRTVMGRETALDPLTWTADGWPMVNRLRGPSCLQRMPLPDASAFPRTEPVLGHRNDEWISPRADFRLFTQFDGNRIRLRGGGDPASIAPVSLLLRRQSERSFTQRAEVDLSEGEDGCLAGLTGYYDERSFFVFGIRKGHEGYTLEVTEQIGEERKSRTLRDLSGPSALLEITADGFDRLLKANGEEVRSLRTEYLCDEGVQGGKRFTGALLGLTALGGGQAVFTDYADKMVENSAFSWLPNE